MATRIVFSSAKTGLGRFQPLGEKFRKDCIRVGKWQVRNPSGGVVELPVTPGRIQNWERGFDLFRQRGISVPLTVDHIQVTDGKGGVLLRKMTPGMAEAKRGEVEQFFLEGDRAMCEVAPADEDAKTLMNRCPEVSIEIEKDYLDALGNYYDEVVTAITLTPVPQIPGQQMQWEQVTEPDAGKLTASRAVVRLSAEPCAETLVSNNPPPQEKHMDPILLARLRTITGLATEPEAQVIAKAAELAEGREAAITAAVTAAKGPLDTKILTLSRDLEAAKAGTRVETIDDLAKTVDEDSMEMAATGIQARINALSVAHKITPTQKTLLLSKLVGEAGQRNVIALSRKVATKVGLPATLSDMILSVFEAGDVAEMQKLLKESSKGQRVELSRATATGEGLTDHDPAVTARMIASANARTEAASAFQM